MDPKGQLASALTIVIGGMVIVLGIFVIRMSPTLIRVFIAGDRWFRRLNRRFSGSDLFWNERFFGWRRAHWWVPRDVELRTPDDLYAYLVSERYRGNKIQRLWSGVAGAYLLFIGGAPHPDGAILVGRVGAQPCAPTASQRIPNG